MYYRFCRLLKSQKGFTLVELMVVLVIIAILVAIAIPLYAGTQNNARTRACDANIRIINGAIAQYYAEHSAYPQAGVAGVWDLVNAGLLKEFPECPHEDGNPDDDNDYEIDNSVDPPVAKCNVTHP